MPSKLASVQLGIGFSPVPFGVVKASTTGGIDTTSLCDCGGEVNYLTDDDGNRIECEDCGDRYSWWNQTQKGYEIGDEIIAFDPDDLPDEPPVETGSVEKVTPVKQVLLEYAVEGNYYLTPEDGYEEQYSALVAVLNDESWAMLTYLRFRTTTRRYAVMSEGGVLLALQLADKKPLHLDGAACDDAMRDQAAQMLDGMLDPDPSLPDVEGHAIKALVKESVEPQMKPAEDTVKQEI